METVIQDLKRYLYDVLGVTVRPRGWAEENSLPIYLQDAFEFLMMELLGMPCLLMVARKELEQTPAAAKKHITKVQERWSGEVIYIRRSISSYNRQRLIEHKVAFIVPDNQMYLPLLGIDLREHFRKIRSERKQLRPSAQTVVLCALLDRPGERYTPKALAQRLGYSPMALTRAFDEVEFSGLGNTSQEGRERVLQFPEDKRELWKRAHGYMRSPVQKRIRVRDIHFLSPRVHAGLTALAHYSVLSGPAHETFAIYTKSWKELIRQHEIMQLPSMETAAYELEIWHYDPGLFARQGVVDPYSLNLSLHHENDERVQSALEEMMRGVEW